MLHFLSASPCGFANPLFSAGDNNELEPLQWVAQNAVLLKNTDTFITDTASGLVSEGLTSEVSEWLQGEGKLSINISSDSKGRLKDSEAKVLYPFYDSERMVIFNQDGFHRSDDRQQMNIGFGIRYLHGDWMIGANTFYDHDFTLDHSRFGAGGEYARDFLRVSVNSYARLSGWSNDKRIADYQSRPANGWDIHTEAWMPAYPQLGGKLNFEQYYGNEVALISYNDRQKNPYAITAGLNYTPVPLITTGVDVKRGKSGANETRFGLNLNYTLGENWSKLISPDAISAQRSLSGSRYEFVSRNNDIVLDYLKKEVITLGFPSEIRGTEQTEVTFVPALKSHHKVISLELNEAELLEAGGRVVSGSPSAVIIKLPAYRRQGVRLSGVAVDSRGNRSNMAETIIYTKEDMHLLTLNADKIEAAADGKDSITMTLHVENTTGKAVTESALSFTTDDGVLSSHSGKTDANGNYTVTLNSDHSGEAHVTATEGIHSVTHPGVKFIAATHGELTLDKITAKATGDDIVQAKLMLTDSAGKVIADRDVDWTTSLGTLSAAKGKTGQDGVAVVTLKSIQAGSASITASSGSNSWSSDIIVFEEPNIDYSVIADKIQAIANGTDNITFTFTATNYNGSPREGKVVTWTTDAGTLSKTTTITDGSGRAIVKLSNSQAGSAHVVANADGVSVSATEVSFEKAALSLEIEVSDISFYATGTSGPRYTLTARNPDGTPAAGKKVKWASDFGDIEIKDAITDINGKAEASICSKTAGIARMTAAIEGQKVNAVDVTFLEYLKTELWGETSQAKADGKPIKFALIVKNIDKQPVAGRDVAWSTTVGQLSDSIVQTNVDGRSEVTLSSTVPGSGNITASINGSPLSIPITFTEDVSVSVTANVKQITSSGYSLDRVIYTATITNMDGSPAVGEIVAWNTNIGTLSASSSVTDSNGKATINLISTEEGVAKVTATAKGKVAQAPDVSVIEFFITFMLYPTTSIADGESQVSLIFTLYDRDSNPLADQYVTWTTNLGTLSATKTKTDSSGQATVTLTSTTAGIAKVVGDYRGIYQTAKISFEAAPEQPPR